MKFTSKDIQTGGNMDGERVYYVSALHGDDRNDGLTEKTPFRTLKMVSRQKRRPGDKILLERGSVFEREYLHIFGGGTKDHPVVIDAYGEGLAPVIAAEGNGLWYQNYGAPLDSPVHVWKGYVSSAVLLYDAEYITVKNLEITNQGLLEGETLCQGDRMNRTGVSVIAKNKGTLHQIELAELYVHDVNGNVYDKHLNNGGIYISALQPDNEEETGIARYDGIHIHHCTVERCRRWGVAAGYTYQHGRFTTLELPDEIVSTYGSTNVVIEYNHIRDIGGDSITPMYCFRPLVQCNISENAALDMNSSVYTEAGEREGMVAAAIWPWKCKTALFQYNEASYTRFNQDGEAWDADSGDGTIYQYNYSHDNEGGCVMFCEGESVNNIFRHNISVNDGLEKSGVITPVRNVDAHISDNTFIIPEGVPFIRTGMSEGGMLVENNVIINKSEEARTEDWHHQTEKAVYRGNLYGNYANVPEDDGQAQAKDRTEAKEWIKGEAGIKLYERQTGSRPDIGARFAPNKKAELIKNL